MSTRNEASEARERLAEAVEKLADSDTFAAWLRARAIFKDYSFGNVCLIVSQRPDASRVAGYKAWQKLGRQVRKGEHGRSGSSRLAGRSSPSGTARSHSAGERSRS